MFVSSYNTYINTSSSDKTNQRDTKTRKDESKTFNMGLMGSSILKQHTSTKLPIDYISNPKSFSNQRKLQEQTKNQDEIKFKKLTNIKSAKSAYAENSTMFSFIRKPMSTLNQAYIIDKRLPKDIQELKEQNLRYTMVNTYLANDNYYRITA
jgi:hypothetical protein